ncbi:hypothetical protein CF319_g2242 [Tilletia indica]|nr:hypothetical protein CF319_g2242 [Tilletia indica]
MVDLYGREWFNDITIEEFERAEASFPTSADIDDRSIQWLSSADGAETCFTPSEYVPYKYQIRSLYEQSKKAEESQHLAVTFVLRTKPSRTCIWSLDKIRIANEFASHESRIDSARQFATLLDIHSKGPLFDIVDDLKMQQMFPLRGSLWNGICFPDLQVLRSNQLLSDTVIEFYLAQVHSRPPPNVTLLPTGVNNELAELYRKHCHTHAPSYSKRPSLPYIDLIGASRFVGWVHYKPLHWTVVLIDRTAGTLSFGCSLKGKIDMEDRTHIEWWLGEGRLKEGDLLETEEQDDGSSCGLAAISMLIRGILNATNTHSEEVFWTQATTKEYRSKLFVEIVRYLHSLSAVAYSPTKPEEVQIVEVEPVKPQQRLGLHLGSSPFVSQAHQSYKSAYVSSPTTSDDSLPDQIRLRTRMETYGRPQETTSSVKHGSHQYERRSTSNNKNTLSELLKRSALSESTSDDDFSSDPGKDEAETRRPLLKYRSKIDSDAQANSIDGQDHSSSSDPDSDDESVTTLTSIQSRQFNNLEDAITSCCAAAEQEGFNLHRDSSQAEEVEGKVVTIWKRLRCKNYNAAKSGANRSPTVDPTNARQTRPAPKRCAAMVNLRLIGKGPKWRISKIDWNHNHDPDPDIQAKRKAQKTRKRPTKEEKDLIQRLVVGQSNKMNRSVVLQVVRLMIPGTNLRPMQVSNIINSAKVERRLQLTSQGGDAASLIVWLAAQKEKDPRFTFTHQVNKETGALRRLFVSSSAMVQSLQRFGDVVIADIAQGRNIYQMPLNVFCVVDGAGRTRNIAYVLQDRQDRESHQWALEQLVMASGAEPSVVMSDQDSAFMGAVRRACPSAHHLLCLWHLWKNVRKNLLSKLRNDWTRFCNSFWAVYRSPSPKAFEKRWTELIRLFPRAKSYLEAVQYPNRRSWAAAWTRTQFTANTRTTGRVESENGVNKMLSGRKTTLSELVPRLLERAIQQGDASDGSAKFLYGNPNTVEDYFQEIVDLLRSQCTIWVRIRAAEDMKQAMFYRVVASELPAPLGVSSKSSPSPQSTKPPTSGTPTTTGAAALDPEDDVGTGAVDHDDREDIDKDQRDDDTLERSGNEDADPAEEENDVDVEDDTQIASELPNDQVNIELDSAYLADMVRSSGSTLVRAYEVQRRGTTKWRALFVAADGQLFCTCADATAMGVPCRHMWAVIAEGEYFSLHQVNPRWYLSATLAAKAKPIQLKAPLFTVASPQDPVPVRLAGATDRDDAPSPGMAANMPEAHAYHRAISATCNAMKALRSRTRAEKLEVFLEGLITEAEREEQGFSIRDPPIIRTKGRPDSARKKDPSEKRRTTREKKPKRPASVKTQEQSSKPTDSTVQLPKGVQVSSGPSDVSKAGAKKRARPNTPTVTNISQSQLSSTPAGPSGIKNGKRARPNTSVKMDLPAS